MAEQRRRRRAGKPASEAEAQTEEKQESWISTVTWALAIAFVVKSFFLDEKCSYNYTVRYELP